MDSFRWQAAESSSVNRDHVANDARRETQSSSVNGDVANDVPKRESSSANGDVGLGNTVVFFPAGESTGDVFQRPISGIRGSTINVVYAKAPAVLQAMLDPDRRALLQIVDTREFVGDGTLGSTDADFGVLPDRIKWTIKEPDSNGTANRPGNVLQAEAVGLLRYLKAKRKKIVVFHCMHARDRSPTAWSLFQDKELVKMALENEIQAYVLAGGIPAYKSAAKRHLGVAGKEDAENWRQATEGARILEFPEPNVVVESVSQLTRRRVSQEDRAPLQEAGMKETS